jgi:glycosyltransferase involved in cell wall biosynthesis
MPPKISIIIPIYNVEQYLRQCLDSVVGQTMRDIQIICVDNGSTDNSQNILKEYAAKDNRILALEQSKGRQGDARNAALPFVQGKYIVFVDSDDWIHDELCQRTFDLAEKHHTDICVYRLSRFKKQCEKTNHQPHSGNRDIRFFSGLTVAEKCSEKLFTQDVTACSKLIRTDFFQKHDFAFPLGLAFEDMPFHWNILLAAKRILYTTDMLYYHRQRPGSTMVSRGKHHFDIIAIYDIIRHDLEKSGSYEDCRQLFLNDKLAAFRRHYREISPRLRGEMRQQILESLADMDWEFLLNDSTMNKRHRKFYMELKNGSFSLQNLGWLAFADFWRTSESHVLWPMKRLWEFDWFSKKPS